MAGQQLTGRPHRPLDLPQRAPPFVRKCVQRADVGQGGQLVAAEAGAAARRLRSMRSGPWDAAAPSTRSSRVVQWIRSQSAVYGVRRAELIRPRSVALNRRPKTEDRSPSCPDRLDHRIVVCAALRAQHRRRHRLRPVERSHRLPHFLAQAVHIHEADADRAVVLDAAEPVGLLHVDRMEPHATPLRVLDERGGVIEPHRLVVEQRRVERRWVMHLEKRARVREQRKAGGMGLGKSVERKRRDRLDDAFGGLAGDAVARHAVAELHLDLLHPLLGALEPHRATELFRLPAREARRHHGHAQQLLLEKRHPQRPRQHRLEGGMQRHDRLPTGPAIQVGMHHVADDRPGTDDCHLHDQVIEALRLQPRQRRHLRARLDLEDANGVGFLQQVVDVGIIRRQVREIEPAARVVSGASGLPGCRLPGCRHVHQLDGVLKHRHHAQPSRSTLTMPMSAQSSLSHWMTTRPGMLAGSSGTTASSSPWQTTMPPECCPR